MPININSKGSQLKILDMNAKNNLPFGDGTFYWTLRTFIRAKLDILGQLLTLKDNFGHFGTILDTLEQLLMVLEYSGHFKTFLDIFGQFRTFWDIFGQFWIFWDNFGHYGGILDVLGQFWTFWDNSGLFGTVLDIFKRTTWDNYWKLRSFWKVTGPLSSVLHRKRWLASWVTHGCI